MDPDVDNDPCKFFLYCRGSSERFTLQAANQDIKQVWVHHINEVLETQSNFLSVAGDPPSPTADPHSSSSMGAEKPPLSGRASTPLKLSTSNGSPCYDPHKHGDRYESFVHDTAGCNGMSSSMLVTQDYMALKENEICVTQGEKVQILATNQQNMFLVFRPAHSHSPAAEGWVPGHVLGPLAKPLIDSAEGSVK
ncbi:hypothetical protein SKAU_G00239200 [Synaphobranchus kaupii]|uniref:Uncharacterized protein n=1 Tax=Synaphobranchus kaupii TaxID=118154 RepID=A0A9Q1F777_SYNKA|nr:hypothetical protein SKAU_G00239200 [Synaphobranchus kaupii]